MSEIESKIISFSDRRFIIWAEPDEGSYNYKMFDLGSRYDRHWEVPDSVIQHIKQHASMYYPIIIVDGYAIDVLLDELNLKANSHVERHFGRYPRIAVNPPYSNSVKDFLESQRRRQTA